MGKAEILAFINEAIVNEKGVAVTIDEKFVDSELDSLGASLALIAIDAEFKIFDDNNEEDFFAQADVENLTIRDLITLCRLSIADTSKEQN